MPLGPPPYRVLLAGMRKPGRGDRQLTLGHAHYQPGIQYSPDAFRESLACARSAVAQGRKGGSNGARSPSACATCACACAHVRMCACAHVRVHARARARA
eukprot:3419917-Alexandrium_andersonii.AAC.1